MSNDNRHANNPKVNETRQQSSAGLTAGNAGGVGNRAVGQPSNLPTPGRATDSAAQVASPGALASSPRNAAADPGLATILGQIAALNWEISGNVRVTKEQEAILRQPVDPDWVEIKYPDVPYLPVAYYRKVLNDAFGPMGWALVEVGKANKIGEVYYLPCVLLAEGRPVAKAVGECEVKGGNAKLTDGDCVEACRSNAITRCCKSIGIAEELHWPAWKRKFLREHCRELAKDKWGNIVFVRKDDEAGAKLFAQRIGDEEMYNREPSMVAKFAELADRIRGEQDLPPPTGRVPRPGSPGREEWERAQAVREQTIAQDVEAEHDSWEEGE